MVAPVIFWKKAPFVRLLIPFILGIIIESGVNLRPAVLFPVASILIIVLTGFFLLPFFARFNLSFVFGCCTFLLFACLGSILTFQEDVRNNQQWFGYSYADSSVLLVTVNETPVQKPKTFKSEAIVSKIISNKHVTECKGKLIIYFAKDSALIPPSYGTQLLISKPLQTIKNTGNPAAFDYQRYCLFQGITHQVYLQKNDYQVLPRSQKNPISVLVYSIKEKILSILRKYIKTEKELGLAEALLIGYKDDLDKSLVQSYSNTGVVHIIAISGLHLGLIYWLLVQLFRPLKKRRALKWLSPFFIVSGLWLFSLMAGAQPSVLRSALMFTCIVLGEGLGRKSNIFNSLALSAFLLLCYNPFWLWDVGFQLSYAAVLSIALFVQPLYNLFYFKNKLIDAIWKLNAVTLAAQVLTIPLCIYHFHQFPNYFLITNLVAVPLSSIILMGEILLCVASFIPWMAAITGKVISFLIWFMNRFIEFAEKLPFAIWEGLNISIPQVILLFTMTAGLSTWLLERSKSALKIALVSFFGFTILRSYSFMKASQQRSVIVYNIPQKQAMDFIDGRHHWLIGDSSLSDKVADNFYLRPGRTTLRIPMAQPLLPQSKKIMTWYGKKILLLDTAVKFAVSTNKPVIDWLIVSKNPRINFTELSGALDIKTVICDASVPSWRSASIKKNCDSLRITFHDVTVNGAFVINLR